MGSIYAEGLTEIGLSLEDQILVHLTSNHYPPVPKIMVEPCIEAIDLANEGKWEETVKMPDEVSYKGEWGAEAPVQAIVEQHHLDYWIVEFELDVSGDE